MTGDFYMTYRPVNPKTHLCRITAENQIITCGKNLYSPIRYRKKHPPKSPMMSPAYPPAQMTSANALIILAPVAAHTASPAITPAAVHANIIIGRKTDTA